MYNLAKRKKKMNSFPDLGRIDFSGKNQENCSLHFRGQFLDFIRAVLWEHSGGLPNRGGLPPAKTKFLGSKSWRRNLALVPFSSAWTVNSRHLVTFEHLFMSDFR